VTSTGLEREGGDVVEDVDAVSHAVSVRPKMSINPIVDFIKPSSLIYLIDAGTEIKFQGRFAGYRF
jgi:hypothetical protein